MTTFVDVFGTIQYASGSTGSPVIISNVPLHGESLVWDSDSEIWKASTPASKLSLLTDVDTKTIAPKNHSNLFYDSDSEKWVPRRLISREDSFFVDSDGKDTFFLSETPHEVTHFFRNGMRIIRDAWIQSDSDAVYYDYTYNGGFITRAGDQIQITYTTISE